MLKIRVDDFPGTKPNEFHEHNLDNYKKFHHVLMESGLIDNYILGCIPLYMHHECYSWLSENQDHIEVAMHGVVHDERYRDEFCGLSKADIYTTMNRAKSELEVKLMRSGYCKNIEYYIPPHNVINSDTIQVIEELGFKYFMGGPGVEEYYDIEYLKKHPMYIHSEFPWEYGRTDELLERGSIEYICKKIQEDNDSCLTLHWTWEHNIGLGHMSEYFRILGKNI